MLFVTQKKSVYVDSVTGSDANDGLTQATPKATCAAGMVVLASSGRKTIRLKCGSFFREQITLPAGKRIKNYGSGARPILDPRENITGPWTLYGAAYTYQQTVNHALSSPSVHRVWEDGVRLKRVANAATVETTPGSFYAATPSGTTGVLYIHPNGDGDPNSNGKTYSHSYRMHGVNVGDGCVVDGIKTGWNGGNDGSIRALARSCIIRNCDAVDGCKHNVLIADGVMENCYVYGWEPIPGIGTQTAVVSYNSFSTGTKPKCVFRFVQVEAEAYLATAASGFYNHGSLVYSSLVYEGCSIKLCASAFSGGGSEVFVVSKCLGAYNATFVAPEGSVGKWYIYRCRSIAGGGVPLDTFVNGSPNSAFVRHSEIDTANGLTRINNAGAKLDIRFSTFARTETAVAAEVWVYGDREQTILNCVFCVAGSGPYHRATEPMSVVADYNLYYASANPSGLGTRFAGGALNLTFAQWRGLTGQDSNSIYADPVIVGYPTIDAPAVFLGSGPVFTSGFPVGVQPTDDAETLALLASVGYTP